jgi:inosine-uridine nucleoside N-ribohydrolase
VTLLRSPWFWITILLIALGIVLMVVLDVFYWLVATLVVAFLMLLTVFFIKAYAVGSTGPPEIPHLPSVRDADQIPVIYDCDLTLGWPFRDVGDGLALLYLLGEPRIDLRGVTTTYGNGPVWMTTWTTRHLLKTIGFDDRMVVRGSPFLGDEAEEPGANRAAQFLLESVDAHPGEIVLLATGVMTNLKHAVELDPDFFKKLRGLALQGGVTGPVTWNKRRLRERNFALDPEAAYRALQAECPLSVTLGEAGLTAVIRREQFAALQMLDDPVSRLIVRRTRFWFALMRLWFQDGGFAMWDSVAAMAIAHPELLEIERVHLPTSIEDLRAGQLVVDGSQGGPVSLIRGVRDYDGFIAAHFAAWHRLGQRVEATEGTD